MERETKTEYILESLPLLEDIQIAHILAILTGDITCHVTQT